MYNYDSILFFIHFIIAIRIKVLYVNVHIQQYICYIINVTVSFITYDFTKYTCPTTGVKLKQNIPKVMYYSMKTKCLLCNNSFIQYLLFLFHKLSPLVLLLSCPLWYHTCIHILHGLDLSKNPEKQK